LQAKINRSRKRPTDDDQIAKVLSDYEQQFYAIVTCEIKLF